MKSIATRLSSAVRHPTIAIALVFLAMLAVSWRRWTSPIADSGREMDLPRRLLDGEWLYRDVHYLYPPFAPYFNATLYRIFGVHLDVLHASGLVCAVLIAWLCYRIARRLLPPGEAAIAVCGVLVWCVFKPAGNLIAPYSFAALYSMVFGLVALWATLRYVTPAEGGTRTARPLLVAGVLIGLAAVTKQEFAFAAAATVTAAVAHQRGTQWRRLAADLALTAGPALAIALPVYGWLFHTIGWDTLVVDCHLFYTHLPRSLLFYNANRTGLDRPAFSLLQMLGGAAVVAAAASAIVLLSMPWERRRPRLPWVILAFSLLAVFFIRSIAGRQWDGSPLRALPLLLAGILVRSPAFRRKRVEKTGSPRQTTRPWRLHRLPPEGGTTNLFVIAVYSLAVLGRVVLRVPSGGAFGGFFLPTSLIVIFYLLACVLPYWIERWTDDEGAARRARRIGRGLFILMLLTTAVVFGVRYRRNFNHEIHAARGHLFAPRGSGPAIGQALRYLEANTRPGEAIAVLPEGADLGFLTGRRSTLRHQIQIPGLMREPDEQAAIAALRREDVRTVLVVNRPMREFGLEAFGRDFYTGLGSWLETRYRVVAVFGAAVDSGAPIGSPAFFIKVYARTD
jgi:4-amino-4-deoxy-L-arabinose transferase-like glycosyltransferase